MCDSFGANEAIARVPRGQAQSAVRVAKNGGGGGGGVVLWWAYGPVALLNISMFSFAINYTTDRKRTPPRTRRTPSSSPHTVNWVNKTFQHESSCNIFVVPMVLPDVPYTSFRNYTSIYLLFCTTGHKGFCFLHYSSASYCWTKLLLTVFAFYSIPTVI